MEIWKAVKGYEGLYEVSNLGRVKSLKFGKERILKPSICIGYYQLFLYKKGTTKRITVHQIVAETFLRHTICGHKLVVNHINFIRSDNRVENLEIVTQRENSNKKHLPSSSQYIGVCWHKVINKWMAQIVINGRQKILGYYTSEIEAYLAYQKALANIL